MRRVVSKLRQRRKWVLEARTAAVGFCRPKARASRWTPALLRWARRGKRVGTGASVHTHTQMYSHTHTQLHSQPSGGSWTARLHLHFHLAALIRDSRSHELRRVFSTSRGSQGSQLHVATRAPYSRILAAGKPPGAVTRTLPGARTSWQQLPSTVITRRAISQSAHQPNQATREYGRIFLPIARAARHSTQVQMARSSIRPSGHSKERGFAAGNRGDLAQQGRSARRELAKNAAPNLPSWATKSPVDLVWRAPAEQASPSAARATSSRESTHTTSVTASAQTPPLPSNMTARTIVRATELEPGLASRLADDVIRRIDRRARIERERQGM